MTFTPDRNSRPIGWLAAALLAALPLPLAAAPEPGARALVSRAHDDLGRGDGIAAEIRLKNALAKGARRNEVAAYMGEALLLQGQPEKARYWLGLEDFSDATAGSGFRALARLERAEGNLAAAGLAYDKALEHLPDSAELWVEIGRLRYTGAQHMLALQAADHALQLDPNSARALEFKGQIVRDRDGLVPALPWFEAALAQAPDDLSVLGEYAATLGDLGRAREMLVVTRRMLKIDDRNGRAFYLQAVLAARAGNTSLARVLLNRAGDAVASWPGAMLLDAVLDISSGSPLLAVDKLERLVKAQPANARAETLLARAMFLAEEHRALVTRFAGDAQSPYMLTLVGRSYEIMGRRDLAADFLDRAIRSGDVAIRPQPKSSRVGEQIARGAYGEAASDVDAALAANPGSAPLHVAAGDIALAAGDDASALAYYRGAARVSLLLPMMLRMRVALERSGQTEQAQALVGTFARNRPGSREAIWQAAQAALSSRQWARARRLLAHLDRTGSAREVTVLTDLSLAALRDGDTAAAVDAATRAYRLQPASGEAAGALGLSLAAAGEQPENARALLTKARKILGDTELLAEARRRLARR